jgi:hypothetical protein
MKANMLLKKGGVLLITCSLTLGCAKKSEPEAEQKPAAPPFQRNEASLAGMVKQERSKIQNDFENLKLYYALYETQMGKPPNSWKDFKNYIGHEAPASLVSGIEEGRYVVVWKAKPSSKNVLAYEKQPDVNGKQVVLFGDRIETISKEELKKALENKN